MKEHWDQRYSEHEFVYGKYPNRYFKSFIDKEKPGSILLPAEGEGRNAIYAASLGWDVYAVDYSKVAQQKALERARKESLSIQYEIADLSIWKTDRSFDCIGLIYAHFHSGIRENLHHQYASILNPGGKIVLEAFSTDQLYYNSGGPKDIEMLYNIDMLESDFNDLSILQLEKTIKEINESEYHKGTASVIRMNAQKK